MSNIINPQSKVILLNVPIHNDYKNQYTFTNKHEQYNFFYIRYTHIFNNLTFIRDGEIIVEGQIYSIFNCNYMMFQNSGFTDKWFYAFITDIEFVSQNSTKIKYELDVFQTWYFDINYKSSFIVRKHVTDDSIGANTLDENLGFGDYIVRNSDYLLQINNWYYIVVTTEDLEQHKLYGKYDNIFSGLCYYVCRNKDDVANIINDFISPSGNNLPSRQDAIIDIFAIPDFAINYETDVDYGTNLLKSDVTGRKFTINYSYHNSSLDNLDGYVPKNNKLYCFPYCSIEITNQLGNTVVYKPELFKGNTLDFQFSTSILSNSMINCIPINYAIKNANLPHTIESDKFNNDISLTISNLPHCGWTGDTFQNYLTQNMFGNNINLSLNTISSLATVALASQFSNPLTMGLTAVGTLSSLSSTVANQFIGLHQAEVTPNQSKGNQNNINSLIANNKLGFYIREKTIKNEYAKIIDDYFTMFGYKVNCIEVPKLHTRKYWNYIETRDININADIPQIHLNKIKDMFNKGVTLWHSYDVGDYSQNNTIL